MGPLIEHVGKVMRETVLGQFVPIGIIHRRLVSRAIEHAPAAIGSLFARWRIVLLLLALNLEMGRLRIADVAHEKRLFTICNQDKAAAFDVA